MAMLVFQVHRERGADGAVEAWARLTGTLEAENLHHFQLVVRRLLRKGVRRLVLDLSGVERVDLRGLGGLEEARDKLEELGGSLWIVGTELDPPVDGLPGEEGG